MILASPNYPDETLVQHGLRVQTGLSQSSKIDTLALCWAGVFPRGHDVFCRNYPTVRTPESVGLAPDSFRPDRTPVTVKKGHHRTHAPQQHQPGPSPLSVSGACLSSALLTKSTESIAAPSWVRNCSIASFIGGGRSPHQSVTRLIASSTVRSISSIAISR